METQVWEIYVPTEMNYSHIGKDVVKPIRTRYHRVWDEKVRAITGGLTIYPPTKGQWVSPSKVLFKERMIPVRILGTKEQIAEIVDMTIAYYNQEAVLAYRISTEVLLVHRK